MFVAQLEAGAKFSGFFRRMLRISLDLDPLAASMKRFVVIFFVNVFASIETNLIRVECMRLINLSTWHHILPGRREAEFNKYPQLRKIWNHLEKKNKSMDTTAKEEQEFERSWFSTFLKNFIRTLEKLEYGILPG
jgi:intron-binding protein aquarius